MQVCFIGHRNIQKSEEVTTLLKQTVANLIKTGATNNLIKSKESAFAPIPQGVIRAIRARLKTVYFGYF
ncbi:MAG: hypothetical protein IKA51_06235 [Clostridia bacterium]|nr:hypothetical protein [Clostridia bacterium]